MLQSSTSLSAEGLAIKAAFAVVGQAQAVDRVLNHMSESLSSLKSETLQRRRKATFFKN